MRKDDFDYKTYEQFESEYLVVLSRRTMRWEKKMKITDKFKHNRISEYFALPILYSCFQKSNENLY